MLLIPEANLPPFQSLDLSLLKILDEHLKWVADMENADEIDSNSTRLVNCKIQIMKGINQKSPKE